MRMNRLLFALFLLPLAVLPAAACPFCPQAGQTLSQEVGQAHIILLGTLSNAKRDPNEFGSGSTDMTIETVVKDNPFLKDKKLVTLPRYVPSDPKQPMKYLVFIEIYKDKLDPYKGEAVAVDSKIGDYLKGAIAVREKDSPTRLKYFYDYLDSPENAISMDAFMEFAGADYKDVAAISSHMKPDTIVKWLQDPNTQPSRYGFYGSLLGHCGNGKEHGPLLRKLLEDPAKKFASGIDGMLAGYVILDPKEGWDFVKQLLGDEKQEFLTRYAALRTVRFFHDYRSDVKSADQCVEALKPLLDQPDIADLPIDDLRKWKRWDLADKIISLYGQKSHSIPIVKRSIIRFALSAPADNAKVAVFLKERRAEDADRVAEIEQLLELEKATPKAEVKN